MHLRTILNRHHKHPGFIYEQERIITKDSTDEIFIPVRPRKGCKPICSGCGKLGPGYDTLSKRNFEFVPLWGMRVFFEYAMRRVDCHTCGVTVEMVPWGDGKKHITNMFFWFVAHWSGLLSWTEVAKQFSISWATVFRCVENAVEWGRKHMNIDGITAIGVDEIARAKGHKYVTLVYQIDNNNKRLLWVGKGRDESSLQGFFTWLGEEKSATIEFVCSDMWRPYLKVIREYASQALNILDRFHIMTHFSKAIDEVRSGEARKLTEDGKGEVLKHTRWNLLKRPENLTDRQRLRMRDLLKMNIKTVKAYLLKEQFQQLWSYTSATWAGKFIDAWTFVAMRSKIDAIKKVARMIRKHKPLILNWFKAKGQISNGIVEGLNGKGRIITKRAYGFRTEKCLEVALYHALGKLPVRKFTHRFW